MYGKCVITVTKIESQLRAKQDVNKPHSILDNPLDKPIQINSLRHGLKCLQGSDKVVTTSLGNVGIILGSKNGGHLVSTNINVLGFYTILVDSI